jgi:pre-mRNA-processing factor 19
MDPFETIRELPLSEDQLITLAKPSGGAAAAASAPPRPQATSLPNLLHLMQKEYDALVLELFDTRKALEDTRRELSQALYQNDAAVRVVARLAQERDAAKHELERWNASVGNAGIGAAALNGGKQATPPLEEETGEPQTKRRRLEPSAEPLSNDIPEDDLQIMSDTWQKLSKERKALLKAAALEAPSPEDLAKYTDTDNKAWHKSSNKGISCMAQTVGSDKSLIATAGKDKQIVVYNEDDQVVQNTFSFGRIATCIDVSGSVVVAGDGKGKITVFVVGEGADASGELELGSKIVGVSAHPANQHICAATADGRVVIACWIADEGRLQQISSFSADEETKEEYTCASLHPDGLVYIVGTKTGRMHIWDLKNKSLAANLKVRMMMLVFLLASAGLMHDTHPIHHRSMMLKQEGDHVDPLSAVSFSSNGYHIGAAHGSAAVYFWDLRKQKVVAALKDQLDSVAVVAFDKSGKYAAMGGKGGVKITTVKEWGTTASLDFKHPINGLVWSKSTFQVSSEKDRAVHYFGLS